MFVFFFNNPATTEIYTYGHTLALHDALPILGEHRRSPGIGGEIAADAARALRTERERKQSADALRGLLHVGKHGTAVRHQHVRYRVDVADAVHALQRQRSEEHTSELQSLMRISYAVFCLNKKKKSQQT